MREHEIYRMNEINARRAVILARQFSFLKCRQEAFERVIKTARLRDKIRYFFNTAHFFSVWDAVTAHLLAEDQKAMEDAAKKPTLTVMKSPVIIGKNGHG